MKTLSFLAFLIFSLSSTIAIGGGGKVKNPVIIDEDTECAMVITGIDTDKCLEVPATDQSGIVVFNCQVTIICQD